MKHFLFQILLLSSISLFAQLPDGYYSGASGKKGYQLRIALHDIIDNHTVVSYNSLWTHFYVTDAKENGTVWDMYSDIPGGTPPYTFSFGTDQCGNYSNEGDCYNREHSVPKSWFGDISPLNSDLFHLYPTDGYVNNRRGNFPYGEVSTPSWTSQNSSKVGSNSFPGYTGTVFEPIDEYKGDFARSYFYMVTRYLNYNLGQESISMFSGSNFKPWALNLLLSWHSLDPVSYKEINRNNEIYNIQNNRNPFIDFPELAGKIFGSDSLFPFYPNSISEFDFSQQYLPFPNPVKGAFFIQNNSLSIDEIIVTDILGRNIVKLSYFQTTSIEVDVRDYPSGIYFVQIKTDDFIFKHKLIIYQDGNY